MIFLSKSFCMYKLLLYFSFVSAGYFVQKTEWLSRQLPVYVQVNNFTEKPILEILIQEKLHEKSFRTISSADLGQLITAAAKKAAEQNSRGINKETDIAALAISTVNSLDPVAQKLMVTMVSDKQGNPDSCYLEIYKTPAKILKKIAPIPRLYITDSIVKKRDLHILVEEIIAVSTGIKFP